MVHPRVDAFFDEATSTASYLVSDPGGKQAAVIDPVLDFDPAAGSTQTGSADRILEAADALGVTVSLVLETHVHADHLSAGAYIRDRTGARIGIGAEVTTIQSSFGDLFNFGPELARDGSQFDLLLADGDGFEIGTIEGSTLHTPGHTPACVVYVIGDAAFVGDTLFMPDSGTARCDFPGGDARTLYRSIQRIFSMPGTTRLFMCHDYKAGGERDHFAWETTVAEERDHNIHVGGGVPEADFVRMREERDAALSVPRLILPAVQVNVRAGELPPPESNGTRYLKLPLNAM